MEINLSYLEGIAGGDNTFVKEILQLFLDHTIPEIDNLKKHLADANWPAASSTAHKMKSSISMLGNEAAIASVVFIEQSAKKQEQLDQIGHETEKLEGSLQKMAAEIEKKIAEL